MKTFMLVLAAAAVLAGQTLIDLRTQTKRVDFSEAQSTKPIRMGSAIPPTCSVGEMYLQMLGVAGSNLYVCVATNLWVPQGGMLPAGVVGGVLVNSGNGTYDWRTFSGDVSGGSETTVTGLQGRRLSTAMPSDGDTLMWDATTSEWVGAKAVNVLVDGMTAGARPIHDYVTGMGTVLTASDTGSAIQMQQAIDTAVVQTRANHQSGADLMVNLTSNSSTIFTGDMTPSITQYTDGMEVQFRPNQSCVGIPELDIDRLGLRKLFEADGVTPMMCEAGNQYAMWYDAAYGGWRKHAALPGQAGNAGKYLKTDGASASWADALPVQTGHAGEYLTTNGTTASWIAPSSTSTFGITVDGGGSTITTGNKGYVVMPFACNIENWSVIADALGSIEFDLWKSTNVPTAADTITASAKPMLSSAQLAVAQAATGWTTAVSAGDVIGFNVSSATTVKRATVTVACKR